MPVSDFLSRYPELVAILLAVAGVLLARLLSAVSGRALDGLANTLRRVAPERLQDLDFSGIQPLAKGLVYFTTLLIFLLLALRALSISVVGQWLDALAAYVPQLILAAIIILAGYLLGLVSRSAVAGATGASPDQLLPRLTQLLIVTAAALTGLGQLAIDISFITDVIVLLLATTLGGLALSFALGSRQLVENLLARRGLERYRIGRRIRVDDIEGEIIEVLDTAVVVESEEGITMIPAARFAASSVTILPSVERESNEH